MSQSSQLSSHCHGRSTTENGLHIAAIALGSNIGDSFHNIELALRILEIENNTDGVWIINTSFLYESAPMYVTEQPSFINCACIVETILSPIQLLARLKRVEAAVGRVPSIRNGPRAVDLDIILYDDESIDTRVDKRPDLSNLTGELVVPHPRMLQREFVLQPLVDMIPHYIHPSYQQTMRTLLQALPPSAIPMQKVLPFPVSNSESAVPSTLTHWRFPLLRGLGSQKTHMMATLNTTPDSFSDGSVHNALPAALKYASSAVSHGSSILDIGGYSTRPGAAFVSVEDEIERVVPVIQQLRQDQRYNNTLISVDTFRWQVAEAAIHAGANCINDVNAFTGGGEIHADATDAVEHMAKMKEIVSAKAVPVILMHSRGEAGSNKDYSAYSYVADCAVLEAVRVELGEKVTRIVCGRRAVRRWLVVVDPGVGFSKTVQGNLEVLRSASSITSDIDIGDSGDKRRNPLVGFPMLIGASRKSFLGSILADGPTGRQTEPKERSWATSVAVACAIQQGALVVRIHDTQEMADVVKVANALWP